MAQGNPAPTARDQRREAINDVTEAGLTLVAEQREISAKRMQKLRIIATLEEADLIERERARHRVDRAQVCLRDAQAELRDAVEDQERQEEISGQLGVVWKEILELEEEDERITDQGERELVTTGTTAGAAYIHPDLLQLKEVVAEQKRLRGASAAEAEVL